MQNGDWPGVVILLPYTDTGIWYSSPYTEQDYPLRWVKLIGKSHVEKWPINQEEGKYWSAQGLAETGLGYMNQSELHISIAL